MNVNATSSAYSSATGSLYSSNGLSGLMSGIDTESMVKKMLAGTQTKIDKQNAIKSQTTWKQELYQSVISDINTFKSKYIDSSYGSTLSTNLTSADFFNSTTSKVTSGDSVSIIGSTTAGMEPMNVVVNQLATAATLTSTRAMSGDMRITGSAID
ncbi:MAG: flagellar hook protein, partial [Ruminococcaceae bacterium]|nr:flagellar hook protein [Oscillospiraceae bacterium]